MGTHFDVDVFEHVDRTFWCEVGGKIFQADSPLTLDVAMSPGWSEGRRILHYRGPKALPGGVDVE